MIPCPHCGAENSAKKRVCFNCRKELTPTAAAKGSAPASPVTPTPAPRDGVVPTPAPLAATATNAPPAAATDEKPAPAPPRNPPAEPRIPLWQRPLFNVGATVTQRAQFFRQLEHLLKAGIPMVSALGHLENQLPVYLRPMVRDLSQRVQRGETLSAGLAAYPTCFVEWEVSIMRAAELSGEMHLAAGEIADTLEMEEDLRRRVNSSTYYLRAVVVVAIFVALLLPNLGGVQGNPAMLAPAIEHTFQQWLLAMAAIVLAWNGWRVWTRSRGGMALNAAILAQLPLFGPLIRNMMRARFALVLGALWNAGVGLLESLYAAARASGNGRLVRIIERNQQRLASGEISATDVIEQTRFFSPALLALMRTGETSGSMPATLQKVNEYIRLEVENQAKILPTQLYLIFFFLVAGAVGYFYIRTMLQAYQPVIDIMQGQ